MSQVAEPAATIGASQALLDQLCAGYSPRDFAVRFWNGVTVGPDAGIEPRFTLVLNHPSSLRQMLWPFNKAGIGEAYIYDDIDIEGDILAFFDLLFHWRDKPFSAMQKLGIVRQLLAMPKAGRPRPPRGAQLRGRQRSENRDRQAVQYHYDGPPTEFYRLFLDRHMQYSCGYFVHPDVDIHNAQEQKLDYICRKLRLKAGERLIDFGCGWGGLITFAAKNYGVHATGITISKEQAKWAEREIDSQGLRDRVKLLFMDYRNVPESEQFDKAVSVGFIEHVGDQMMPAFFGKVFRLLRPKGLYLNHGITFKPFTKRPPWREFTLRYVFPDGELVSIDRTLYRLCEAGFEIRDVESLREHYARTLECWRHRLEENHAHAVRLTDEVEYRIYRIYFAGAQRGFLDSLYNLNQTLVVKSGNGVSDLPLTRADWYR